MNQWHYTAFVVQAHVFDDAHESCEITVHDYLLKLSHDIISFKLCEKIIDFWISSKVDWHIERGLKVL